jgi:predicted RNase H-like HicB family nuclease
VATLSYEVIVTREGDYWLADVPSVRGAHTFARSLPSLFQSVREVIVLMKDLPDDAVPPMTFRFDVPDQLVTYAAQIGHRRAELAEQERQVRAETTEAIEKLTSAGYSVRDTAALVGVTAGRVSQVASETRARNTKRRRATAARETR